MTFTTWEFIRSESLDAADRLIAEIVDWWPARLDGFPSP
jgi:hypothetical protein